MLTSHQLDLLQCPSCSHDTLTLGARRYPSLDCAACSTRYPIVDGIPDMLPPNDSHKPGTYRTETLSNLVAGVYHTAAPLLSLGIWNCSPLRWVDSENRALGRANGGVYLRAPISTGLVLDKIVANYHDVTLIGADRSWNMLRQAAHRLRHITPAPLLLRVDYERMPFKPGVIDSLQSFNGLQTFQDRAATLTEFKRCLKEGGFLSGSALVRGQEVIADATLERLEQSGVYPMLRAPEFLLRDLEQAALGSLHHETHGAVMFYSGMA